MQEWKMVKIKEVLPSSIAEKAGVRGGDNLISISGFDINDVLDYRFYLYEKKITLKIERDGELLEFKISKKQYDDIGLEFETPLMDKKHSCRNKCIFCFIDQLPSGLRETLYFKDDDSRLSFLHGNYITLTNLSRADVERIVKMHISPVNVSVHTTNPELRCKMMNNRFAGESLEYLKILKDGNININAQIVLCRGVNDGAELERSLSDLSELFPQLVSVAVVPSGLTKHREGLYPLEPFDMESSAKVIDTVEKINAKYAKRVGKNLFYCSDEFYLTAKRELPKDEYYEEYSQLENGVGMLRSFECEAELFIKMLTDEEKKIKREISIATGESAYEFISSIVKKVQRVCPNLSCNIYKIENDFFGHTITVAGLITGKDLINQLSGKDLGSELLISRTMLRSEGDLFLCGTSLDELGNILGVDVKPVMQDGACFVEALLGIENN